MAATMRAIRLLRHGGPEVLAAETLPLPEPGPGEIRIRVEAAGVNFIDTYHRSGLYPLDPPCGIGLEAAGIVDAVGPGVTGWTPGMRAGGFLGPVGAYAEYWVVPAARAVRLPEGLDCKTAAAIMLKAATVEYLVCRCAPVKPGMTVLFHAGAGGVGHLALPWLKALGATVITTVGSHEKAALARARGADHVILYREEPVAARVREITGGGGVDVVFDGVGAATWRDSLASLRRRGMLVSFGNASGPVPPVSLLELTAAGSVFVTRPSLMDYYAEREEIADGAARVFAMWERGVIRPQIAARLPLEKAAEAHRLLESRATTGSVILVP
ncbi:MAG: quinone oxidoreductase [Rhodothalassiaceae bacterium]|nr:MAG: quinone oxidoreductase [Rhodothalassiaceae bacterium]